LLITSVRTSLSYRLRSTGSYAVKMADQLADERRTLTHNDPLKQAVKIEELRSSEGRYRKLAAVIAGLSISWKQDKPGREKPHYTFLTRNGFDSNGKHTLTLEELEKAERVFYSGWILPVGTKQEDLKLPAVYSTKLLFAKCPCCGKMQLVVRCFRRKGLFWWLRQKPEFYILCLDCQCVYIVLKGIEILENTN